MFPQPPAGAADELDLRETTHSGGLALLRLYHEAERPVVAHYWYKSCAMCKLMKPVIQRVVREYADQIYYVDVEISANKKTMKHAGVSMKVRSPALAAFGRAGTVPGTDEYLSHRSARTCKLRSRLDVFSQRSCGVMRRRSGTSSA